MKTIGIDIGTTTVSGVVLDASDGHVCDAVTHAHGCFIPTENAWERIQDAERLLLCAKDVLDELISKHPDTSAIGLTGAMHGIVYTDAAGKPVSSLYTWEDGRGDAVENGTTLTKRLRERFGIAVSTGYGLVTHLYQQEHGAVPKNAASLCTIADCFGMLLTGLKRPMMHASNAASLGFFNAREGVFRRDLLEQAGMELSLLPDVTRSFDVIGYYGHRPVTVALGDNQAAYLGSAGDKPGSVLVNVGTGGQTSMLSTHYCEGSNIEARPFTEEYYLLSGSALCAGRAYATVEKFLSKVVEAATGEKRELYTVMAKLAEEGRDAEDKMIMSTLFSGTRADPSLRGGIQNLSENNFTPAGMVYAALRGIADELYGLYVDMPKGDGEKPTTLIGSGNGLRRNPVLQQAFSELFGMEMTMAKYKEEAASGAAACAAMVC